MKNYRTISRVLSVLLILAMVLPCISMTAFSQDIPCVEDGCSGHYRNGICTADATHFEAAPAEGGVYRISNAGQLYWFAALVNAGENEYDGDNGDVYNAVLTADITINADLNADDKLAWIPIGLYTGAREFVRYSGTFDGAGHTIYGLYYENTAYTGRTVGLFGCLDSNGTVKDLTLADASVNGATDIGGIVSHNYGTVKNCTLSGSVSGTGATGGIVCRNMDGGTVEGCENTGSVTGAITGGIAAQNSGSISGCTNGGTVSGTNSVGGIVGMNDGTVADSVNTADVTGSGTHVGGVAGNHIGGGITGCGSSGAVSGASDYIGGVAGACVGASITESYNTGAVTGAEKSEAVGGVAGAIDGTNTDKSAIVSCYNTGAVSGRSWVGGIAGVSGYQKTPQTVEVRNSYSTGTVTGTTRSGAVIGSMSKGSISGVYYLTGDQNTVSGATAATAEQFASGEIAYKLNGSTSEGALVWKQTLGVDASPRFEGRTVFYDGTTGTYHNGTCEHTNTEIRDAREATCTEPGYTGDTYCADCGEKIADGEETDALGHAWKGLTCENCGEKRENPFNDVDETIHAAFLDAILWAVDNDITKGTGDGTTFSPAEVCKRATVVTFLWRAAGSPEPTSTENPFTDVKATDFYYKAVLWAVEKGITNGMTASTFGPMVDCNRAQVVTFLWRAMEKPAPTATENPFTDVNVNDFYGQAVLWAIENGITNGMTATTFAPTAVCNRAQVVTFLYRAQ